MPTKMFPLKTTLQDAVRVVNWLCIVTCVGDYSLVLSELNSKFRGNQLANFWKLTCCILQKFLLLYQNVMVDLLVQFGFVGQR